MPSNGQNIYTSDAEDVVTLISTYRQDSESPIDAISRAKTSYDTRRSLWPNKSPSMTKDFAGAQPWRNASDLEVPVSDNQVSRLVALCMNAIQSGQVIVSPRGHHSLKSANTIAPLLRYFLDSWIPNARQELEFSVQQMFERGVAATITGWERKSRKVKETIDTEMLEQLAEEDESFRSFLEAVMDEAREDEAVERLQAEYSIRKGVARKAIRNLRNSGVAEFPMIREDINRPTIQSLQWLNELVFPSYTMHIQKASRCSVRMFMTPQDLLQNVETAGFNRETAEFLVENAQRLTINDLLGPSGGLRFANGRLGDIRNEQMDLIEIVCMYRRLIDKDDGSVGIYETWFSPHQTSDQPILKHDLLDGWDEFPVAVSRMEDDAKLLVEARSLVYKLRGNQKQQKILRDSGVDNLSIAINPPRAYPSGRPPSSWGAGATFAERTSERGLNRVLEIPGSLRQGVEMEQYLDAEARKIAGLDSSDPADLAVQQYYVNRALNHVSEVLRLAFKWFVRSNTDPTIEFRVSGNPDPMEYSQGPNDEEIDVHIVFDARTFNPDFADKMIERMATLKSMDTGRRLNANRLIDVATTLAIPQFAYSVLQSSDESQAEILKAVANDLALIWSGQQPGAQPNASTIALPYLEQYTQKPSVMRRIAEDEEFAENLERYVAQYEFETQQQQNAETGRIGTDPAELQGVNVE